MDYLPRHKSVEELTFTDDFMFGTIMKNKPICKGILERLLHIKVGKIEYPSLQKTIAPFYESKGIRLDVYVAETSRVFDIEIQTSIPPDLPKRTRYYQSLMDVDNLLRGQSYTELKDSYVIFICTQDPFGKGLAVYTFENTCREDGGLFLDDRTTKVFYNVSAYGKEKDDELHALLRYLCKKQATSHFTQNIDALVESTKNNERFRSLYMSLNIHKDDLIRQGSLIGEKIGFEKGVVAGIRKGRSEGVAQGFSDGSRQKALQDAGNLKHLGVAIDIITQATGLSKQEVEKI
ncbi:hypothetical protein HMPREF9194_00073 [Treponema maltophilum ATCC 51939]|uniref:Transposase (putative) YhgA-like domain-containing protein n=1 Tax=Treponema maltophilum ATCC 51939 TaxID=1125699 RepID=S3K3J7_TREMA|nr:Rpn family recombination-promoting nuclease/putative transposase [Treponema maltophilum]EPF32085.1 hypothetical protein HMPREF9194_00073 [Treponema maltophilum ATCC 51939]